MSRIENIRLGLQKLKDSAIGEYRETVVAGGILLRMARGSELTDQEVKFLKSQSLDLLKIAGIIGLNAVPGSTVILLGLEKALNKHGLSMIPKKTDLPTSLESYRLFLDDERMVEHVYEETSDFITVRSLVEFKEVIRERGLPTFISFDHDLGVDQDGNVAPSGYDAAKWLVHEMELDISDMSHKTHSWNIQTRDQISGLLNNWKKELNARLRTEVRNIIQELNDSGGHEVRVYFPIDVPQDILSISEVFKKNGYELFLVGGCVRDAVMGKQPKDFDLATDAMPDDVEKILSSAGYKTLPTGKAFGIINVITDGDQYEIATFRSDHGDGDGRRPDSVSFTDMKTDAKRRDLTINALYYDIASKEIIDTVGGLEDIKNGVVRTVGNAEDRFREDRLRIMRCIRFAARTGHDVSPEIDAALKNDSTMNGISAERIRDEFLKGVDSAKSVTQFLGMLWKYDMFKSIFPDAWVNKDLTEERDHAILIAWLLMGNGIDKAGRVLQTAKYTANEVKAVKFLIGLKELSVATAYLLKKAEANAGVSPEQIVRFGSLIGMPHNLMHAFVEFKLSVTASDLEGTVKPGPEMGVMIRGMETRNFESLL